MEDRSHPPTASTAPALSLPPRILHCGDSALIVQFGDAIDRAVNAEVLRLRGHLLAAKPAGIVDLVPTFRSLAIHYDPRLTREARLRDAVDSALRSDARWEHTATVWEVPVCYADAHAPDLAEVAERTGLGRDEVVALHTSVRYYTYMVGFTPGYPYLGDLDARLELPRRRDPRVRVPAGSVCIATTLTAIYPLESPGGWHLIGTTPISVFDARGAAPALFSPGDWIEFAPISPAEFESIRADTEAGRYRVRSAAP